MHAGVSSSAIKMVYEGRLLLTYFQVGTIKAMGAEEKPVLLKVCAKVAFKIQ